LPVCKGATIVAGSSNVAAGDDALSSSPEFEAAAMGYADCARMRRTEVRPICNRRAISALLTPARCNFRT
jgi:hypothetical protein